jgi:hypothetical protein
MKLKKYYLLVLTTTVLGELTKSSSLVYKIKFMTLHSVLGYWSSISFIIALVFISDLLCV